MLQDSCSIGSRVRAAGALSTTLWMCALATCAACATGSEPGADDPGSADGDSSSVGGAGPGAGGASVASGSGAASSASSTTTTGSGATSSASASSSGASSSSSSGSGGAGGAAAATKVVFVAGGGSAIVGSYVDLTNNSGWSTPLFDQTVEPITVATGSGKAHAFYRAFDGGELRFLMWTTMSWSPPAAVSPGLTVAAPPSALSADANHLHLAYLGDDGVAYYAASQFGLWTPTAEIIAAASETQPPATTTPAIVMLGADIVALWAGEDGDLHDRTRSGGAWQAAPAHGLSGVSALPPALIALDSGPELLAVFVDSGSGAIRSTTRSGGVWSAPIDVGATSAGAPSVAALAGGDALVAYRSADGGAWTVRWSGGAWGAPVSVGATQPIADCPPQVARGAQGADAELVWVDAIGAAYWTRLVAGAWTASSLAGTAGVPSCVAIGTVD